jgi:ABC-type transport system substrate-binding protein
MNSELDGLIERFQTTVPMAERMQVASQIVRHLTEQLPTLPLFYDALPIFVPSKLTGVHPSGNMPWNVHEWAIR